MSDTEIILHHFDASPFAEKVRVALGIKGLDWRSVEIPMVMPKPDLTALTGGYRKTPVMQLGADVYCDTQRIARELEARFDGPALYPEGQQALCEVIAAWSDATLFVPGAGLSMGTNLDLPEPILADRFAFFDFLDRDTLPQRLPALYAQFRAGLQRIDDMLSDGRPFLLGEMVSWADAACYAPVWMCRGNIADADTLLEHMPSLAQWEQKLLALGHGRRSSLTADAALAISRQSQSRVRQEIAETALPHLEPGVSVEVSPEDYGAVPVAGRLLRLTQHEVVLARSDERAGDVVVHFPRLGCKVVAI
ncbi:glutathione S-transferase family protein [Pseudohalioglobus sediminis]|uniref:Glutathione S-transferase family protein n=1 Tax=Pseudohalioglobus sediminis TaxID=2606449 RepID=A0A5B0WZ64_9GAMM|nr:glutathione S-transferase family protein [Pseudohalioglobus sediminis]KAA1192360.1 glutathione S-transferase family protein [Pseudohalioglobus sediminis]